MAKTAVNAKPKDTRLILDRAITLIDTWLDNSDPFYVPDGIWGEAEKLLKDFKEKYGKNTSGSTD